MLNKVNYTYNGENSVIHNINGIVKIVGLIIYLLICFLKFNNILFIWNISFVFVLLLLSNIPMIKYFKVIWKLKFIIILSYLLLLRLGMVASDINIILFKVIFFILYIVMIIYTTPKEEVASSVTFIIDRINLLGFNIKTINLFFNNILVYFECVFDSYNEILVDMELKGLLYMGNSFVDKIVLFFKNYRYIHKNSKVKMKQRYNDMNYRLYDKRVRTKFKYRKKLVILDYIYILLCISMIIFYIMRVR